MLLMSLALMEVRGYGISHTRHVSSCCFPTFPRADGPAFERGDELLVCEPRNLGRVQWGLEFEYRVCPYGFWGAKWAWVPASSDCKKRRGCGDGRFCRARPYASRFYSQEDLYIEAWRFGGLKVPAFWSVRVGCGQFRRRRRRLLPSRIRLIFAGS